jgi:DNA-binding LacI/PurR family transcriptional regulator
MKAPVTMQDIAKKAAVSTYTVSTVLGGKWQGEVSEKTASRVEKVAKAMGYVLNLPARHLRSGRSGVFAYLTVLDHDAASLPDTSLFFYTIHEISRRMQAHGAFLTVVNMAQLNPEATAGLSLFDGFVTMHRPFKNLVESLGGKKPAVDFAFHGSAVQDFGVAVEPGFAEARKALQGRVSKRVFFAGDTGYEANAQKAREIERNFGVGTGAPCVVVWADAGKPDFLPRIIRDRLLAPGDLVFCANDALASQIYQACRVQGLGIPRDVRVVGYNDDLPSRSMDPPLSTIALPREAMFDALVAKLLGNGGKPERKAPASVHLPCRFQSRSST